jgi:hypothetical protein
MATIILLSCVAILVASCKGPSGGDGGLTLAVVSGVEGDALKQAARDYESLSGVHINIAEFPYDNLFEKELIDLTAATGAYDLIMPRRAASPATRSRAGSKIRSSRTSTGTSGSPSGSDLSTSKFQLPNATVGCRRGFT